MWVLERAENARLLHEWVLAGVAKRSGDLLLRVGVCRAWCPWLAGSSAASKELGVFPINQCHSVARAALRRAVGHRYLAGGASSASLDAAAPTLAGFQVVGVGEVGAVAEV